MMVRAVIVCDVPEENACNIQQRLQNDLDVGAMLFHRFQDKMEHTSNIHVESVEQMEKTEFKVKD